MSGRPRRLSPNEAIGLRTGFRHQLRQIYRGPDLIVLGLGVMVGAGIYSLAAKEAGMRAGPGVILSMAIAGFVCLLTAFCFAELSSAMPASGGAFSFTYVIFGEFWAWIVAWALLLELGVAAAAIARVWSAATIKMLHDFGLMVSGDYIGRPEGPDLLVLAILVLVILIVAQGARLGLRALWVMVAAKLLAIVLLVVVGARHIDPSNYQPFIAPYNPEGESSPSLFNVLIGGSAGTFGWTGVFASAAVIVFAYIGFDLVATSAEEAEDGPRTVPRGIIGSLLIGVVLYLAVSAVMIGMVPHGNLGPEADLTTAFQAAGEPRMGLVIDVAAVIGLTTVLTVLFVALTRVVFSIARSGLLPAWLASLSPHFRTPSRATLVSGLVVILVSEFVPVLPLFDLVVIGTLTAFAFVAAGVIAARVTLPDLKRGFRVPLNPLLPMVSIAVTLWLMMNLAVPIWIYYGIWLTVGVLFYLFYGRNHSVLAKRHDAPEDHPPEHPGAAGTAPYQAPYQQVTGPFEAHQPHVPGQHPTGPIPDQGSQRHGKHRGRRRT